MHGVANDPRIDGKDGITGSKVKQGSVERWIPAGVGTQADGSRLLVGLTIKEVRPFQ
jgi:hypothetical protein